MMKVTVGLLLAALSIIDAKGQALPQAEYTFGSIIQTSSGFSNGVSCTIFSQQNTSIALNGKNGVTLVTGIELYEYSGDAMRDYTGVASFPRGDSGTVKFDRYHSEFGSHRLMVNFNNYSTNTDAVGNLTLNATLLIDACSASFTAFYHSTSKYIR